MSIVSSDPVNQKQLEVDAAANPRNPNHLLAGYITYVSALENPSRATSTGRCGYSFSTNGGKTWQNGFLPDLPNMDKCGDPAVTWDTNGHAFYFGLSELTDGATTGMTVWRFTDPDDGSGRLVLDRQVDVDRGTASDGQVLDKGAIHFQPSTGGDPDAPGTLYACYGNFDGKNNKKIVCALSTDGGTTYSKPNQGKYNGTINSNNGTAIAPGPDGSIYLFWRAFTGTENGYYLVQVQPNGSATNPVRVPLGSSGFHPYDAPTRVDLARSNAFPAVASDGDRKILLTFQAFADATGAMAPSGPATSPRIFAVYSDNGGSTWSAPRLVDAGPHPNAHQFMPRAAYAGGIWSVLFYDARYDGCPEQEPTTCPGRTLVFDATSGKYLPRGRDRRFDLRVAQSVDPTQFTSSTQVTLYETRPAPGALAGAAPRLAQRDPRCSPNCPAFNTPFLSVGAGGTSAWMGDYIAHAAKCRTCGMHLGSHPHGAIRALGRATPPGRSPSGRISERWGSRWW